MERHLTLIQHGSITHGRGWRSTCGQAALATIAGVSLEKACEAIGHRRPTTYKDLMTGLKNLRIKHGPKTRHAPQWPRRGTGTFLIRVHGPNHFDHWIVEHCGLVYDSVLGTLSPNAYLSRTHARMTSHIEITLPPLKDG